MVVSAENHIMRLLLLPILLIQLSSCWYNRRDMTDNRGPGPDYSATKVWGSKPIYSIDSSAKKILYKDSAQAVVSAGNIYTIGHYIFQVDAGRGVHVIDNTIPKSAKRIGFITLNGCSQISVKGTNLYSNSYEDLVVIDLSDIKNVHEISRVKSAFPEFLYNYPLIQPDESGYYECPRYDSVVVGWKKDSIYSSCYKN
jgi:hypothetical protein